MKINNRITKYNTTATSIAVVAFISVILALIVMFASLSRHPELIKHSMYAYPPNGWNIITDGVSFKYKLPDGTIISSEHLSYELAVDDAWKFFRSENKRKNTIWTVVNPPLQAPIIVEAVVTESE